MRSLNNLRSFIMAAKYGSFASAANELCITPAAISQQIKQLEEELGASLLMRSSTGVQLTAQGKTYLPFVEQAFASLAQGQAVLHSKEQAGVFKIAALPSVASKWLMPKVYDVLEKCQDVDIRVEASHSKVDFNQQDFDACISFGAHSYPDMHKQRLFNDRVFAVASPKLLQAIERDDIESIVSLPMIHVDWGRDNADLPSWQDWFEGMGLPYYGVQKGPTFNLTNLAVEAALQGRGLLLGQESLIQAELASGALVKVNDLSLALKQDYFLVYPERSLKSAQTRRMIALLFALEITGESDFLDNAV